MQFDAHTLAEMEKGSAPRPVLRFFKFSKPTVSFGRLQQWADIAPAVPSGWLSVQRPTGGGIVFHQEDLCFSLCWPKHATPIPEKFQDQYRWIHAVVLEAMSSVQRLRMACCQDVPVVQEAFPTRRCFTNPVGYDLLDDRKKMVGGALRVTRKAILYQGSIQMKVSPALEERICNLFRQKLG